MALPWKDTFWYVDLKANYWLSKDVRDTLYAAGQDDGNLVFAVGFEWRPQD
jgi:hypothetical protein